MESPLTFSDVFIGRCQLILMLIGFSLDLYMMCDCRRRLQKFEEYKPFPNGGAYGAFVLLPRLALHEFLICPDDG